MDEQEKDLQQAENDSDGALTPPQDGAEETTGESYSDADRRETAEELVPAPAEPEAHAQELQPDSEESTHAESFSAEQLLMGIEQPAQLDETIEELTPAPAEPEAQAHGLQPDSEESAPAESVSAEQLLRGIEQPAQLDETIEELVPAPAEPEAQVQGLQPDSEESAPAESFSAEQLLMGIEQPAQLDDSNEAEMLAILEAIVYITDEPLSAKQIADAVQRPLDYVKPLLDKLVDEFNKSHHGLTVKEIAGGYKMYTKPEHHEAVRSFVKNLNPPLKLSLASLETLAVIAYKQPITAPEIMEIRGVQGAGVLKTLLDRKLITAAGRKNVVGKPILYKTTKEFLVQFGLRDLNELPSLKEFEDLRRFAFSDADDGMIAESQQKLEVPADEAVSEAAEIGNE